MVLDIYNYKQQPCDVYYKIQTPLNKLRYKMQCIKSDALKLYYSNSFLQIFLTTSSHTNTKHARNHVQCNSYKSSSITKIVHIEISSSLSDTKKCPVTLVLERECSSKLSS